MLWQSTSLLLHQLSIEFVVKIHDSSLSFEVSGHHDIPHWKEQAPQVSPSQAFAPPEERSVPEQHDKQRQRRALIGQRLGAGCLGPEDCGWAWYVTVVSH